MARVMARGFSISIRSEYNLAKSISLSFSSVYGKMSCDCRESCRNLNFQKKGTVKIHLVLSNIALKIHFNKDANLDKCSLTLLNMVKPGRSSLILRQPALISRTSIFGDERK